MGAWGHRAFDNDTANDWASDFAESDDLSLVESALAQVEEVGDDYLDQDVACCALAACEVLTRRRGNYGYKNAYTKKVDAWVAAHSTAPSPAQGLRATGVIDRILGENSELRELWDETGETEWHDGVRDLRQRLGT
jgi:hypothetical protein